MGTIARRRDGWRAQIARQGIRESRSFATRQQAADWITAREAEILSGAAVKARQTLAQAAARWRASRTLSRSEETRLRAILALSWASDPLGDVTPDQIAAWRDKRLVALTKAGQPIRPSTVAREMTTLRSILTYARRDLGWIKVSPMADVRQPKEPPPRDRVIHPDELTQLLEALGWDGRVESVHHEVACALLVALETAMRAGEILGIRPADIRGRVVHLPKTKNGEARDVPLSSRALELFALMKAKRLAHVRVGRPDGRLWHIDSDTLDALFRRARKAAGLAGFTFHDSRATALTRLSRVLSPLELARMSGHRDLRMLMTYYRETAEQIAERLG